MNGELIRLVDSIHRDKDIDKELVFLALEDALVTATRKHYGPREEVVIEIDRFNGEITGTVGDEPLDLTKLGRIDAQTAKQVIIQKTKELESDVIFADYQQKIGLTINGSVQRVEGSNVIVNLGRVEGLLPRREQIRDEVCRVGDRIKCIVLDVRRYGQRVKVLLSRTHPDIVRSLFELEVPEVTDRIIEIKQLAREPGSRTKIAVVSHDMKVDCVGACVGVRGSRIKNIVAELGGEKIDIVRHSDQPEAYIANALNPAEISNIGLNPATSRAKVIVAEDQLSLAIGKRGQNVRLAARLTGWDIDVMSQEQYENRAARTKAMIMALPGLGEVIADRILASGYHIHDLAVVDIEYIIDIEGVGEKTAGPIVEAAKEELTKIKAEEAERNAARKAARAQEGHTAADRLFAGLDKAEEQAVAEAESAAAETAATDADETTADADETDETDEQTTDEPKTETDADEAAPTDNAEQTEPDSEEDSAQPEDDAEQSAQDADASDQNQDVN